MKKYFLVFFLLFFCSGLAIAATITPWGDATLQNFDILIPNSGGLDLVVDGNTTYLASERQGLYVLDTLNLNDIKVRYQLTLSDFGISGFSLYSIIKFGDYLYCGFRTTSGDRKGYLKVVNLSNLETTGPVVEMNDIVFPVNSGQPTGLFLSSVTNELYIALRVGGIALIDISTPSAPVLVGKFEPGLIEHQQIIVDKSNDRAYFGGWFRGIGFVDISDADPTKWVEKFIDDASANDRYWYMAQRGQLLYAPIADSPSNNTFDEGLAVYDLAENFSDSTKPPVRVGFAPIPAQFQCESAPGGKDEDLAGGDPAPHQVLLNGDYAIVGNGCMGIAIFDITDPSNPFFIKEYEIPDQVDYPWSVEIIGDSLITVGRNRNGVVNNDIYVFKITPVTFSFAKQVDVPLGAMTYSDVVTLNGLGIPINISVTGGEYSINGAAFISSAGVVKNGDSIQVRLISSSENSVEVTSSVTIGGASDVFSVTTLADSNPVTDRAPIENINSTSGSGASSFYFIELILMFIMLVLFRLKKRSSGIDFIRY